MKNKSNFLLEMMLSYGDMELVAEYPEYNLELFTSIQLKNDFKTLLKETPLTSHIHNKFEKYIDNNVILPCRYNSAVLWTLLYKTKVFFIDELLGLTTNASLLKRSIGGFFDHKTNRIYLLIDNNTNITNDSNQDALAQLTLHELSHYLATNNTKEYFSEFKKYILIFYNNLFKEYFSLNDDKKNINLITESYYNFATESELKNMKKCDSHDDIKNYIVYPAMMQIKKYKQLTTLSESKFNDKFNMLTKYLSNALISPKDIIENYHEYKDIYMSFLITYHKHLKCPIEPIKYTFFYQELAIPSEIICVSSINPDISKKIASIM